MNSYSKFYKKKKKIVITRTLFSKDNSKLNIVKYGT